MPVELVCTGKAYEARGSDTAQGFVVFAGSTATADIGNSLSWSQRKLREDLLKTGVLQLDSPTLRFTQDYAFSSPSTAASLIHGRSANGRIEWRAADGRTLKEIQEAEAAQ